MLTDGVTGDVTVIVIAEDVAVSEVTQARLLVNTHVILSLFASVLLLKVAAFEPTFTPFFFHW